MFGLLLWTSVVSAQVPPQSICYQAVATDADGRVLPDTQIGILISIIPGAPGGTPVWTEAHKSLTDEFGLFNLNIGEGVRMGGTVANFEDINWGSGKYFLRVDMDVAGGTNYLPMGINQMLSVPYSLYAGNAGQSVKADTATVALTALNDQDTDPLNEIQSLQYDATSGMLSIDGANAVTINVDDADPNPTNEIQSMNYDGESLSLVAPDGSVSSTINFGDHSFGRRGASFDFPQGIFGEYKVLTMGIYTVPFGKVLYLTGAPKEVLFSHPAVAGGNLLTHPPTPNMPVFPAGSVLTNCQCTGFEVPEEATVQPVVIDLSDSSAEYTVPAGKVLFVKSGLSNDDSGKINVDGFDIEFFRPNLSRWTRVVTLPGGSVIKKPSGSISLGSFVLTGYLVDM